ncbi:MAG: tRNA uridine-5-carboxymethylaminomethyl(34) synthesis enzyme MnmG [Acholeplasmataceae bacterium]|nr:tRNA uridine-5-carboxymethylaminomethyl(34) synthesis enzyme MnmG [Acholeplasmataceae bacterium]
MTVKNMYDIIVVGGGHAGVEAALASARLKNKTLLLVGNKKMIASMPCNPSIGGPAKGIIVREIDALGGEMAKATDKTLLQIKMLNVSKGPAVRALRAQSDKIQYPKYMQAVIEQQENLEVREIYVERLLLAGNEVTGVELENKEQIKAKIVIIASGTYLDSRILVGHKFWQSGPDNQRTTSKLSESLKEAGLKLIRLKTGTPPRIKKNTIDFSKTVEQPGDNRPLRFSETTNFEEIRPIEKQEKCYLTYTTEETHKIINDNLTSSSMYSGIIKGVGPRYCPSIEAKVVLFSDKKKHQVFLEPESLEIDEIYVQGLSTSLPHELQIEMVHTVPGLEKAEIAKYAYAIEYDAIDPLQLKATLESKSIKNLFFAGQVNGTSGYEEAACQGLIAGINASLKLAGKEPLILRRDEAYIGVLIDDIITKGVEDPYRLLTSRAEFRLLLRHDNAEERLIKRGYEIGLISEERYQKFLLQRQKIEELKGLLEEIMVYPKNEVNDYLLANGKAIINEKITGKEFLRRPEINFDDIEFVIKNKIPYSFDVKEQVTIEVKYEGYIKKEYKEAKKMAAMETRKIPEGIDYNKITNLAIEAKEKLEKIRPATIAQASRISGVNPSDITILLVYLEGYRE